MIRIAVTLLVIAIFGCTSKRTIEELCADFDASCLEYCEYPFNAQECIVDGNELRVRTEQANCNSTFDEYIACVDEAGCAWRGCSELRTTLDRCIDSTASGN